MLKIKKQIKNLDGTVTEIEGTEAEVEAFLRKQEKKRESPEPKKNLILGKGIQITIDDLRKMIHEEIKKLAPVHNHFHYDWMRCGDYWWRPGIDQGRFQWQYTTQDPYVHPQQTWCACDSVTELASAIGAPTSEITATFVGDGIKLGSTFGLSSNRLMGNVSSGLCTSQN